MLFCARHRSCADAPDRAFGAIERIWAPRSCIGRWRDPSTGTQISERSAFVHVASGSGRH